MEKRSTRATARLVMFTATAALAASYASADLHAADSARKGAFGRLDADADGTVTRSEAKADSAIEAKFDLFDANHDGVLSQREFDAAQSVNGKGDTK